MDEEKQIKKEFDDLAAKIERMSLEEIDIGLGYPYVTLVQYAFNELDVVTKNDIEKLASENPIIEEKIRAINSKIEAEKIKSVQHFDAHMQKTLLTSIYKM